MVDYDALQRKIKVQRLDYDVGAKLLWQWSKDSVISLREFKDLMFILVEKKNDQ